MRNFMITTDTTCDLPEEYITEHELGIMSLTYTFEETTYCYKNPLPLKEFYQRMRSGALPTTAQVNPEEARTIFQEMLDKYDCDILHIAFSSGMSGSYNSARIAAEELAEEGIAHKIIVIDSLSAACGQGLLVQKTVNLRDEGKTLEEAAKWVEENKLHVVHSVTVDDLNHLYRGGRLSKTSAVIGSIVNVKPIISVNDAGVLVPLGKIRGRKKSLSALVDNMEEKIGSFKDENALVCIGHGDCPEDAEYVAKLIRERLGLQNIFINYMGPIIGCHAGPGAVLLCYMGEHR